MAGPTDSTGKTQSHWFTSSVSFTLIMHIIVGKLFIETVFWNWLSSITNVCCLAFYYICVLGGNTAPVAEMFQPEINGQYFEMLASGKEGSCNMTEGFREPKSEAQVRKLLQISSENHR